jgi:hypothetical protein
MKTKTLILIMLAIILVQGVNGALTDNLTNYLTFDSISSTTIISSVGLNGSLGASPVNISGVVGRAYQTNGVSSYVLLGNNFGTILTGNFTLNFWLKTTASATDTNVIHARNSVGGYEVPVLAVNAGGISGKMYWSYDVDSPAGAIALSITNATIKDGNWHMITISKSGGKCANYTIYLDGSSQTITCITDTLAFADSVGTKFSVTQPVGALSSSGSYSLFSNMSIDEYGIWDKKLSSSEVSQLYNSGSGLTYPFVTSNSAFSFVSSPDNPLVNHSFSQSYMNFSLNASLMNNSLNCSLNLNGVVNDSKLYSNLSNMTYNFSITFDKAGLSTPSQYNWSISCKSNMTNVTTNSSTFIFYLDQVYPNFATNFINGSFYYVNNLSAFFNFSDDFYLHSFNISIDGIQQAGLSNLSGLSFQYNFSTNISNLSYGSHVLTITTADGHTANKIPDYDVSTGLLNQYLEYGYKGLDGKNKQVKISTDSVLDTFSTKKETDRYTFDFQPSNKNKPFYEFNVETDEEIIIINDPSTYLKTWVVFGNKWLDFYLPNENASVEITKITNKNVKVKVSGMNKKDKMSFKSIGDLNIYSVNYTFFKVNASTNAQASVFGGSTTTLTLDVYATNLIYLNNSASLIWNNISRNVTATNITADKVTYSSSFTATGVNGSNVSWTWFFNISNMAFNVSGTQNFVMMNITNCSAGNYVIFNYTLYDEETQIVPTLNASVSASIENFLTIQNPNDLDTQYNFTIKELDTNLLICFPNQTLQYSSWIVNAITKYEYTDHVNEFHYIDSYLLTNASIPNAIALYDLQTSKSTSFLITYQDENYIYVEGVIVDLLRKYISQSGSFYSVEHAETDVGGQTRLHFVTEDVIYKANVWQNGILLYSTGEFQALCQATPCQINLRKPYSNIVNVSILGNIVYSMTSQSQFQSTKQITFAFSTKDGTSTGILMNVTKTTNMDNDTICSQSVTLSSGSITCTIPASYYNATYTARVYKDGSFLGWRIYSDAPTSDSTFGRTGVFLTAIAYLMLSFMGIASATASIVLGIIGLIAMSSMNLIDGGSAFGVGSTILWLIIAGAILIWKYQQRRNQ